MNQREHEVRRCATELLDELGVDVPPVDPVWIARQEGLSVEEKQLSTGVFGALWKRGDSFGIIVSQSCPTIGHRRFSLAHELGHYHVDGHVDRRRGLGPSDRSGLKTPHDTASGVVEVPSVAPPHAPVVQRRPWALRRASRVSQSPSTPASHRRRFSPGPAETVPIRVRSGRGRHAARRCPTNP